MKDNCLYKGVKFFCCNYNNIGNYNRFSRSVISASVIV